MSSFGDLAFNSTYSSVENTPISNNQLDENFNLPLVSEVNKETIHPLSNLPLDVSHETLIKKYCNLLERFNKIKKDNKVLSEENQKQKKIIQTLKREHELKDNGIRELIRKQISDDISIKILQQKLSEYNRQDVDKEVIPDYIIIENENIKKLVNSLKEENKKLSLEIKKLKSYINVEENEENEEKPKLVYIKEKIIFKIGYKHINQFTEQQLIEKAYDILIKCNPYKFVMSLVKEPKSKWKGWEIYSYYYGPAILWIDVNPQWEDIGFIKNKQCKNEKNWIDKINQYENIKEYSI
jgi:hypothetical protein